MKPCLGGEGQLKASCSLLQEAVRKMQYALKQSPSLQQYIAWLRFWGHSFTFASLPCLSPADAASSVRTLSLVDRVCTVQGQYSGCFSEQLLTFQFLLSILKIYKKTHDEQLNLEKRCFHLLPLPPVLFSNLFLTSFSLLPVFLTDHPPFSITVRFITRMY